jgi:cobalt/nickel transport protein
MGLRRIITAAALTIGLMGGLSWAHFQVLLPSTDTTDEKNREVALDILFTHPMSGGPAMEMGPPKRFGVTIAGEETVDLTETLKKVSVQNKSAYEASYRPSRPGDHIFFLEPAPYWEPAEGCMIVHYTKVVVNAFGLEEGWDSLVGLPVELKPLSRPYGLWAGNIFQAVVLKDGEPVPHAEVEIEFWNPEGEVGIPAAPYATQVVKADANGVFSYAMPRAGWYGFAALITADEKMENPDGEMVEVEEGALMWVQCREME